VLFRENHYPEVATRSRQSNHGAIVFRTLRNLANECSELSDQWRLPAFDAECWTTERVAAGVEAETEEWLFLLWPKTAVAIRSLECIRNPDTGPEKGRAQVSWDGPNLLLRQSLLAGDLQRVEQRRIEAGWAIVLLNDCAEIAEARSRIAEYQIEDKWLNDHELPRGKTMLIRRTRLQGPACDALLEWDPYQDGGFA
jgi:hypothetical protein